MILRDLWLLSVAYALLILEAALGATVSIGPLMPSLLLPFVIYLGMAPEVSLGRGALLSFALGALADSATGHSLGLLTFLHVATFLATRGAGLRLLVRGRMSQIAVTAAVAALGSLLIIALQQLFRPGEQLKEASLRHLFVAVVAPSLTTGALAPWLFRLVRRFEHLRRRDDTVSLS